MSEKYQYETIKVDITSDGIAHIQLNRPKKLNTLSAQYDEVLFLFYILNDLFQTSF